MVSMERPKDDKWTSYDDVDELIQDLKNNKTPHAVDLVRKQVDRWRGAALGDALAGNASLQWLRLDQCRIGVEGAAGIGRALGSNTTLLGLLVARAMDGFGDEGAVQIAEGVGKSRSLKEIDLVQCKIGAVGSVAVGKALRESQTLERLVVSFNNIGDAGAVGIAEGIAKSRSLKEIELRDCGIRGEGCVAVGKALGESQTLETLVMYGNHIRDEGMVAISEGVAISTAFTSLYLGQFKCSERAWVTLLLAIKQSYNCETFHLQGFHYWDQSCTPKALVGDLWGELDLPPGAEGWWFKDIFEHWAKEDRDRRQKMFAFAMCMHPRLGGRQGSVEEGGRVCHCHGMKEDALRLVGVAFLWR